MKQLFVDASSAASKAPYCVPFDIALHSYRHTFSSPPPPPPSFCAVFPRSCGAKEKKKKKKSIPLVLPAPLKMGFRINITCARLQLKVCKSICRV